MDKSTIVGIDLGTTNSVVSVLAEDTPRTIKIDNEKLLPSAVSYADGVYIVGQTAKNMAIVEPENTCLSIKRKMGEDITIKLGNNNLRPEDISSIILKKIKTSVEKELKLEEGKLRAVVTIPAYFTEEQRQATKQAAELAGIQVERIINEPTAAALAFGLSKIEDAVFAIYDLGGGTFDISIIENSAGIIEVLSSKGNNKLGGDDFDELLADFIWKRFAKNNKIKDKPSSKVNARLKKIAEETKIKLSKQESVLIQENFFYKIKNKPVHLELKVTKTDFEYLIKPLLEKTISLVKDAFEDAEVEISNVEGIILVGGSSLIPLVTKMITSNFNITPALLDLPDEAVSHGATIQGAIINNIDVDTILVDITPHSLGVRLSKYSVDELLMQAMMDGKQPDDIDKDEIEKKMKESITGVIIPKNTPIPVKRTSKFSASSSFQKAYDIQIFQGENVNPEKNHLIGKTLFEVKKPVERGEIEVTFELDINGIINMSAIQIQTKDKVIATFKSSRGIKKHKEKIVEEIANIDDSNKIIINRAEKMLKNKDINKEDRDELNELIEKYKKAITDNDEAQKTIETELLDLLFFLEQ